jgi:hypothetical protein
MDRDEEVGLHAPRFLHALGEGHVVVAVAHQHRAHVRLLVDARLQAAGDGERHVLLLRAVAAARARVLAAVAGVDRHDDQAVDLGRGGGLGILHHHLGGGLVLAGLELHHRQVRRQNRGDRGRLLHRRRGFRLGAGVGHGRRAARLDFVGGIGLALQQRHQRVERLLRVEVEHQAMLVLARRRQREDEGPHLGLQVEHDAHDARPVHGHAHRLDVGIGFAHLRGQRLQLVIELEPLEVDHQALGILHEEELVLHRARRLERDAGVLLGGPHARGDDARGLPDRRRRRQQQRDRQQPLQGVEAGEGNEVDVVARHVTRISPRGEDAVQLAMRPAPLVAMWISTSAGGSRPAARSGHSTRVTVVPPKLSRKPASVHSLGSWNL